MAPKDLETILSYFQIADPDIYFHHDGNYGIDDEKEHHDCQQRTERYLRVKTSSPALRRGVLTLDQLTTSFTSSTVHFEV